MGVYADTLAQAKSFSPSSPLARWLASELQRTIDPDVPAAAAKMDTVNTIQQYAVNPSAGTFSITCTRQSDGLTFTTAATGFASDAATVEGIIDTAAGAVVPGWTNGDIAMSGSQLTVGDMIATFSGTSVSAQEWVVTFNVVTFTGGDLADPPVVITTPGQTLRPALGVLIVRGVVTPTVANQSAVTSTTGFTKGEPNRIPTNIVRELMREAAAEDTNNSTYHSLEKALFDEGNDRANLVQTRVTGDE